MSRTRVSQTVTRPTRTGVQGGAAYLVLEGVEAFHLYDFDGRQWAWAMLAGTALLSFVQTYLENRAGVGFLRAVPPRDEPVDVPGEAGAIDAVTALVIAILVVVLLILVGVLPIR